MINHVRTLLLNLDPRSASPENTGYEFVPPDYQYVTLPMALERVRHTLFGNSPDAVGRNYRLRQFLPILHCPEVEPFTLKPDSRITYLPATTVFFDRPLGLSCTPTIGEPLVAITYTGDAYSANDNVLERRWYGTVVASPSLLPIPPNFVELVAGDSSPVTLPGFNVANLSLASGEVGDAFELVLRRRPAMNVAALAAALQSMMTPATASALFGVAPAGDFAQFHEWWSSTNFVFKMAGVLLALAYRTDHIRQGL
jgi:hypothetical protein